MADKKKHYIIEQFEKAFEASETYSSQLTAKLLNKGMVGKPTDEKTIDDIVETLHSKDVAQMMAKALGAKAKDLSPEDLHARYGLNKHQIKELLAGYKSITGEALLQLAQSLVGRMQSEMVSHHPAAVANIAYKDAKTAQDVTMDLYRAAGGDRLALTHEKEIKGLKTPNQYLEHLHSAYQRVLPQEMARGSERLRKAVEYKK